MRELGDTSTESPMSKSLRLNYLYMEPTTHERFSLACDQLGWAYKSLAQQVIHAFFKVNRDYYAAAALADCEARGMSESDYYRILRDESEEELERYLSERPAFGPTPLDRVPEVLTGAENKRRYNTISLGNYNYVLLRVARIVDMGGMTQLVSRMVAHHFDAYWEKNYLPQIRLDQNLKFRQE